MLPESSAIGVASRERYWKKLQDLEPSFSGLSSADAMKRKETAEIVSPWLREKTRTGDFKLIQEENMNYGFIRNVFSVKSIFLRAFSIYSLTAYRRSYYNQPGSVTERLLHDHPRRACCVRHYPHHNLPDLVLRRYRENP